MFGQPEAWQRLPTMRPLIPALAACAVFAAAAPARASDKEELIIAGAICGVAVLATVGVAGGLATWENGAASDTKRAANTYRAVPSQANARAVAAARGKWAEAHDFNSTDDKYLWLVGLTGLVGGSMCLGVGSAMLE